MNYQDFTNLYSISKTLRFELRPIGRTREHIETRGLLQRDIDRLANYNSVKGIIDDYHKSYVEARLSAFELKPVSQGNKDSLEEYLEYRKSAKRGNNKDLETVQQNLRKQISKHLINTDEYKRIDKKELIEEDLVNFVTPEKRPLLSEFKGFTAYFTGYHKNRQNMYSDEAKSTSIAYRLINENLPKFIDNVEVFNEIKDIPEMSENIDRLNDDFAQFGVDVRKVFELGYFNSVLTQSQITLYNAIIGGISDGGKGLNQYVNEYNNTHKSVRLSKFKVLYKQILSDREHLSWLPEKLSSDAELLDSIKYYYESTTEFIDRLKNLLDTLDTYDLDGVYLRNGQALSTISKRLCGDWSVIDNAIINNLKLVRKQKRSESYEVYENELRKLYKKQNSFSVKYINDVANLNIESYFISLCNDSETIFGRITAVYKEVETLYKNDYSKHNRLSQNKNEVAIIKSFLDALLELQHIVKPLLGTGDESHKDNSFYGELNPIWEQLDLLTPLYNMVRNYITQKPYSTEKVKLNFESSQLLGGWDKNKERDCLSVILRKDGKYYLGIMEKSNNKVFDCYPCDGECYEKMNYKLLPGANKMLPKVFFSKSRQEEFGPSDDILRIYNDGTIKKGVNFSLADCHKLIDFYKDSIAKHNDWSKFGFEFSSTSSYEDISGFYNEVEKQGYKLEFQPIAAHYIDSLVDGGKLYLFQIYNKDFSEYSKGTPNMHTLYWRALFDENNLRNIVYKLNGEAEIFYRQRSLKYDRPTHPANEPIANKNQHNIKKESIFTYPLIKNRRYTVDKFMFHVPITLNFKNAGIEDINPKVREYLHSAEDVHIIGIDRGERNLLYLVVIDTAGRIVEQISLNEICNVHNGNTYKTDYHSLLSNREEARLRERQSWQTIEGIKELKDGYLSQVIHKVAELMVKYKAIVVLEDLNLGFMRGRQKVEKSVYQKFEKMLIDKLNYLVDKKADPAISGGLLNAYQLTNKFDSFAKLGKQSGFLFYVPAWNTSKIDPVTGFVNLLDLRYESEDKAKTLIDKFDSIRYNQSKDWFEFEIDYDKFTAKAQGTQTKWRICSYGTRIETFRNCEKNSQWDNREVNLTKEFKSLFDGLDIYGDLKSSIMQQSGKSFFERLLHLLRLTLQMRNSISGTNVDYIVSPVADANGVFFDSRNGDKSRPRDADANGAYNIARKGLMIVEQLQASIEPRDVKTDLSNKNWLQFAQRK